MGSTEGEMRRERQLSSTLRLPIPYLRDIILNRRESRITILKFFVYVPFVVLFVFLFYSERDVEDSFFAAEAVRTRLLEWRVPPYSAANTIGQPRPDPSDVPDGDRLPYSSWTFFDVGQEIPDSYSFFQDIVVPALFPPRNESVNGAWDSLYRDLYPDRAQGAFRPVGPLRLRAKHVQPNSCTTNPQLKSFHGTGFPCNADWESDKEEKQKIFGQGTDHEMFYGDPACDVPLTSVSGWFRRYNCGGYQIDIPFTFWWNMTVNDTASNNGRRQHITRQEDVWPITVAMQNVRFLHSATLRYFGLDFFLYNPTTKSFVRANVFFEVTAGGGWIGQADVRSFLTTSNNAGFIIYALVVLGMFGGSGLLFFLGWFREIKKTGKLIPFLLRDWHVVDLLNLLCYSAWFVVYLWWWSLSANYDSRVTYRYPSLSWVNESFALTSNSTSWSSNERIQAVPFQQALIHISEMYWVCIYLNAVNLFLIFLKFLHYLRVSDRVRVLESTLAASARALISVVVLLCLFVLAYTIAGVIVFGPHLGSMRNIQQSWTTLFRTLIGSFDYEAMERISVAATAVYFWTFVVFGLFVLLNFCIAILMQNFREQSVLAGAEPLHMTFNRGWERFKFFVARRSIGAMLLDVIFFSSRDWRTAALHLLDAIEAQKRAEGETEKLEGYFITFGQMKRAASSCHADAIQRRDKENAYVARCKLETSAGSWVFREMAFTAWHTVKELLCPQKDFVRTADQSTDSDDDDDNIVGGAPASKLRSTSSNNSNIKSGKSNNTEVTMPRSKKIIILPELNLADIWIEAADAYETSVCAQKQKDISKLQTETQKGFLISAANVLYGLHDRLMRNETLLYSDSFQPVPSMLVVNASAAMVPNDQTTTLEGEGSGATPITSEARAGRMILESESGFSDHTVPTRAIGLASTTNSGTLTVASLEGVLEAAVPEPTAAPRLVGGHSSRTVREVFDSMDQRLGTLRALLLNNEASGSN